MLKFLYQTTGYNMEIEKDKLDIAAFALGTTPEVIQEALQAYARKEGNVSVKLLTVKDVAQKLSCTTRFIYKLIDRGELRRIKIGRSCRLLEADIERLIQRRLEGKGGDPMGP